MSETRIKIPPRGYYSMPRGAAQDARLSLGARGLLALMLSLPENWDYTVSGLAVKASCGRDRMRKMLRELEDVGYLVREQSHDSEGRFDGNVYVVQDEPPAATPEEAPAEAPEATLNLTVGLKNRQRCSPLAGFAPQKIIDLKDNISSCATLCATESSPRTLR